MATKSEKLDQAFFNQFRFDPFIGPIRDPNLPHDPPNPNPLSPVSVNAHPDYEQVAEQHHLAQSRRAQGTVEIVVRHRPSDTFWQTYYDVRLDSSDANEPAHWTQVKPRKIEIVVYDNV